MLLDTMTIGIIKIEKRLFLEYILNHVIRCGCRRALGVSRSFSIRPCDDIGALS